MSKDSIRFIFKHPNGEVKTVRVSMDRIINLIEDELLETVCSCDCQPVGESNFLDCGCWDHYQECRLDSYQILQMKPKEEL